MEVDENAAATMTAARSATLRILISPSLKPHRISRYPGTMHKKALFGNSSDSQFQRRRGPAEFKRGCGVSISHPRPRQLNPLLKRPPSLPLTRPEALPVWIARVCGTDMAAPKAKSVPERREPVFDVAPAPPRLRNRREAATPRRPKPSMEAIAPGRKRRSRKGGGGGRWTIGRVAYWGAVVGLWLVIAAIGGVVRVGAHLPPIQSLEIPKRPPSIKIVDLQGRLLATRGDMGGAAVPLKDLPRYVPQAFVAIEDRRFYSHYGIDPIGIARASRQHPAPRRVARRLDPDPAARQEPVPDPGAHPLPQGAGGGAGAMAGAQIQQDPDPRSLSQPGLLRRRRLWHRGGGAALFQQAGDEAHGGGGRHARRPRALAVAARAKPQPGRRREARRRPCSPR